MSIRIVIDNDDANDPGVGDEPWTANLYDTDDPEQDNQRVALGRTPSDALAALLAEFGGIVKGSGRDPQPWRSESSGMRYAVDPNDPTGWSTRSTYVFDPRPGYSQNREDYA